MAPPIASLLLEYLKSKRYEANLRSYRAEDVVITKNAAIWKHLNYHKENYIGNIASDDTFVNEMQKIYARLLRNEIFARHGKIFSSKDLQRFFGACKWYKQNPNYSDQMLNQHEKQNIQYMVDFEKNIR